MKKRPKILIAETCHQDGTHVLNLVTEEEVVIPYSIGSSRDHTYRNDPQYAGCGPGYWYRVYLALQHRGWEIEPEDFGAGIAVMIYTNSILLADVSLTGDAWWEAWKKKKKAKIKELFATCEV